MPAQSNRGIWLPAQNNSPKTSGVRKCCSPDVTFYVYYYYSKADDKWYTAEGSEVHHEFSYGELSR